MKGGKLENWLAKELVNWQTKEEWKRSMDCNDSFPLQPRGLFLWSSPLGVPQTIVNPLSTSLMPFA